MILRYEIVQEYHRKKQCQMTGLEQEASRSPVPEVFCPCRITFDEFMLLLF